MTRLRYDNGSKYDASFGLFCRMPTLSDNYFEAMRFGYIENNTICKFNNKSSWAGTGYVLQSDTSGHVLSSACGYSTGSDFYLTFVYTAYDDTNTTDYEEWIEKKRANGVEKAEY